MDFSFLTTVAASGNNCFVGFTPSRNEPGKLFPRHIWTNFKDEESTTRAYRELVNAGAQGIYFTPGSFSAESRKKEDCLYLRSFFVDLDAGADKQAKHGADKVYLTAEEAWYDLQEKLDSAFPRPTYVVFSGVGIHAYWVTVEDISYTDWKTLAARFKLYCQLSGLKIDPARTADASSIMRVPGSRHQTSMATASVVQVNSLFHYQTLRAAIEALPVSSVVTTTSRPLPEGYEHNDLLQQVTHRPCSFGKIIETHELTGQGCQALYDIYKNQASQSYQDWGSSSVGG